MELRGDGFEVSAKTTTPFALRDVMRSPRDAIEVAEAVRELRPGAGAEAMEDADVLRRLPEPRGQEVNSDAERVQAESWKGVDPTLA